MTLLDMNHVGTLAAISSGDVPLDDLRSLAVACGVSPALGGSTRRTKCMIEHECTTALLRNTSLTTNANISDLRDLVDTSCLPVSTATGGARRRTKDEVLTAIVKHLAKSASSTVAAKMRAERARGTSCAGDEGSRSGPEVKPGQTAAHKRNRPKRERGSFGLLAAGVAAVVVVAAASAAA